MNDSYATIVIFCKRPKLGQGKQRLAQSIGTSATYDLARHLVSHTEKTVSHWKGSVVIALTDVSDGTWCADQFPNRDTLIQVPGDLGTKINDIDNCLRAKGHSNILYIGTDSPALSHRQLLKASKALKKCATVYIPTVDGGVSVMGSSVPWPDLSRIRWSTQFMYADIISLCNELGLSQTSLKANYDIDYAEDIYRLNNDSKVRRKFKLFTPWFAANRKAFKKHKPTISIIIPTYKDNNALAQLLTKLSFIATPQTEIIIVDGNNSSECSSLAHSYGAQYVSAPKGRGVQLNYGAQQASGSILWFLHSDATPTSSSLVSIANAIREGHEAGCFQFALTGKVTPLRSLFNWGTNMRVRYSIPYGDQGIFVRKDIFDFLHGFENIPLFEEVRLMKRIRHAYPFTILTDTIGVHPRKWEREGWVRTSILNRLYSIAFILGISPEKLAYAYQTRHKQKTEV